MTYVIKKLIICQKPGKTPVDNFQQRGLYTMADETSETLKIRFRFPGGEEFEAEGNREFIEQQRNYFLSLIGKLAAELPAEPALQRTTYPLTPARPSTPQKTQTDSRPRQADLPPLSALPPAQRESTAAPAATPPPPEMQAFPALRLWERILKEDGEIVLLRRKMRLTPQDAASLLIAGARVLLKKPAYGALELSRSMKKSGFNEGRLDRLLAPLVRNGHLLSDGTKRGRTYQLTNEGFARSFVLAEKLAAETL